MASYEFGIKRECVRIFLDVAPDDFERGNQHR